MTTGQTMLLRSSPRDGCVPIRSLDVGALLATSYLIDFRAGSPDNTRLFSPPTAAAAGGRFSLTLRPKSIIRQSNR